ncbi:MAG: GNAT family N-acetyltransferase [Atopobiaceae bacterium]|nr:GNAT family N-acetyltransferase [Atopobiaceae bacterium]
MLDKIRIATEEDFEAAWKLYVEVCEQMPNDAYSPGWTLGVFPAKAGVREAIEARELYVGMLDSAVVAAFVLSPHDDEEYRDVPWPSGATGDDVSTVHLLAVHPYVRGKHVSSELIREAVRLSRSWGKRAVHLDVMPGNLAASRVYLREGFSFVCEHEIFYEDTGTIAFEMYEHAL